MSAMHTPGPWFVNHDRPDDKISQISISNGNAWTIANVVTHNSTHGFSGGMANAALIARAPDLLADNTRLTARVAKLEAALREIATTPWLVDAKDVARAALTPEPT